ncbi:MAG: hypothetical protein ABI831_17425 [Betaproteobacteria bacterium]
MDPFEQGGGRLGQACLGLPAAQRSAVRQDVLRRLDAIASGPSITLDVEAFVASGAAPAR